MSAELTPTIGRIVYFKGDDGKTLAAIITSIVTDTTINLAIFHEGMTEYRKDVQQGDGPGTWDWMPYQKYQQVAAEGEEASMLADAENATDEPTPDETIE